MRPFGIEPARISVEFVHFDAIREAEFAWRTARRTFRRRLSLGGEPSGDAPARRRPL
jgi:hypothetical protein